MARARWLLTETPLLGVAAAIFLGLFRIGDKSIWLDEAFSINVTNQPTLEMLAYLARYELDKSPYYLLLQPWTWLGRDEATVRALSVVFGVVGVLATFVLAKRYGVAWLAALVLAVAPSFVQYEQEARGYTLLIAVSALSTLAFVRLRESWTWTRATVYVALGALIIYVHPLGALVVVAHGLVAVVAQPTPRRRLLALYATIGLLWLPMLAFAATHTGKIAWIEPITLEIAARDLAVAAGGGLVAGALLILVVLGARRDLMSAWLIVPIVGTLVISLVIPALQPKFVLGALPAAAIIASRNRSVAVAVLIALSLFASWNWYETGRKDDWRAGAAFVAEHVQPGDGIVFASPNMRQAFGYYAQVGDPLVPDVPWSERYLPYTPLDRTADIDGIAQRERIWLVQGHGRDATAAVRAALEPFTPVLTMDYGGSGPYLQLLERVP